MRESLNLFLNRFYQLKVNLLVNGAGQRLDQRSNGRSHGTCLGPESTLILLPIGFVLVLLPVP